MPPTGFDQEVESSANVNQVEKHFAAYMNSGIRSRLPSWTRNHWTADKGGVKPKRDRRAGAFHEVSAATVAPGPYWTGFHGVKVERPRTGSVLTPRELMQRTRTFAKGMTTPKSTGRSDDGGFDLGDDGPGELGFGPGGASLHHFDHYGISASGRGTNGVEPAPPGGPFVEKYDETRPPPKADPPSLANWDKISNTSPEKNFSVAGGAGGSTSSRPSVGGQSGGLGSGRAARSARGLPRGQTMGQAGGQAFNQAFGGGASGRPGGSASARSVGRVEAGSWKKESGSWAERPWA